MVKRWILLHLFPDLVAELRWVAQYDTISSAWARGFLERYNIGKERR